MSRPRQIAVFFVFFAAVGIALSGFVWSKRRAAPPLPATASGTSSATTHPPPRRDRRLGGLNVTFLVAADTHFGFDASETDVLGRVRDPIKDPEGTDKINAKQIATMNAISGKSWPPQLSGTIGTPRGLLICGDLTEDGKPWQWRNFVLYYGLRGGDGLVKYPVFEGHGNHDKHHSWYVLDRVRERHGGTRYAFDWDDLHLVGLGEAPDDKDLDWLAADLREVGRERPVVVYFHFPLRGPYSEDNWFGRGNYRDRLGQILTGYNVIALFHGHYHASGRYRWKGIDVYNVGAAKHRRHSFGIVHITDDQLQVASYHYMQEFWEWWHRKPIQGGRIPEIGGGEHAYSGKF